MVSPYSLNLKASENPRVSIGNDVSLYAAVPSDPNARPLAFDESVPDSLPTSPGANKRARQKQNNLAAVSSER